ncbi:hypothetical protein FF38_12012 [Lucilia cuprina]|uniref:F5/8 type C domain-containing protein n=1 Tax=Lucilia cuprina TaxID=7375 RepID=A0A0L0CFF2_LUCCU|nr:hypothetical protein FF38_12012 [Lucilia cuprina]
MAKTKSLSSTSIQRLTLTTTCNMFSRQCLSYQLLTLISIVLYQSTHTHGFDIGTCNMPLGMESGAITDAQITASSAHDTGFVGPQHARKISNIVGA